MSARAVLSMLLVAAAAVACSDLPSADDRMKPLIGADEAALIAGMGRTPDASWQSDPDTRRLQWKRDTSFAVPNALLAYQYSGNATRPIVPGNTGIVGETCIAEWTVERGVATGYRWQGYRCPSGPVLR